MTVKLSYQKCKAKNRLEPKSSPRLISGGLFLEEEGAKSNGAYRDGIGVKRNHKAIW
ncbi:protein of unknown function [Paenibacillus alvei]|uniref:Uncharacterized protein n=1 Tax=Paenibacillus alvei TaxID=44250 RepID=A0A383R5A3_PAEAL|nr:protein of unknown function [Paenibacillus alvei]